MRGPAPGGDRNAPRGSEGRGPEWWRRDAVDAATWEALEARVADGDLAFDGFATIMTKREFEERRWPRVDPAGLASLLGMLQRSDPDAASAEGR